MTDTARPTRPASSSPSVAGMLFREGWPVLALVVVGAYLRLYHLGVLGIHGDEDLSSLVVQAILGTGVPVLPTGMTYIRGGAFLYLMAGSAKLLGFSELAMRLPAALFSIAAIPLAYVFAKRLFGTRVGLLVAAMLTFSGWDIELARYARMYSAAGFLYLLTVLWIWDYRVRSDSRLAGVLLVFLAMLAITAHQLAYTLSLLFLIPVVLHWKHMRREPVRMILPVAACGAVGTFFLFWQRLVGRGYSVPFLSNPSSSPVYVDDGTVVVGSFRPGTGSIDPPDVTLLANLTHGEPVVAVLLISGVVVAAALLLWGFWKRTTFGDRVLAVSALACGVLQLFNLALLAILGLAFLRREGVRGFLRAHVAAVAGITVLLFLVWIALGMGFHLGDVLPLRSSSILKATAKQLIDFPRFSVFWGFLHEWPLMSAVAIIGGLWAFDKAARPAERRNVAAALLLLVFAVPVVMNGLFRAAYSTFRYDAMFDPYYFCFVALGIVKWRELLPAQGRLLLRARWRSMLVTGVLTALVVSLDLNPLKAWLLSQRDYGQTDLVHRILNIQPYPDFKTTAAFVEDHATDDDLVFVFESREYYSYLGTEIDYWISSIDVAQAYHDGERIRDKYVGTPAITSLDELEAVFDNAPGVRKWLIASDNMMEGTRFLSDDLKAFVRANSARIVYTGRDGSSKVYLFD